MVIGYTLMVGNERCWQHACMIDCFLLLLYDFLMASCCFFWLVGVSELLQPM